MLLFDAFVVPFQSVYVVLGFVVLVTLGFVFVEHCLSVCVCVCLFVVGCIAVGEKEVWKKFCTFFDRMLVKEEVGKEGIT